MKAHLINTHLIVPKSRSFAKVKVKYQGHVSQKMGVSGALVFHKHILFFNAYNLDNEGFNSSNWYKVKILQCSKIVALFNPFPNKP